MASLQRSMRRLGHRRQRQLLEQVPSPFASLKFGQNPWREAAPVFVVLAVLIVAVNRLLASWLDTAPYLSFVGAITTAAVGTGLIWGIRHQLAPKALPPSRSPGALAAAVRQEIEAAGDRRAESEELSVVVGRAWAIVKEERFVVLVLEAGADGYVCLQGPIVEASFSGGSTVPQRLAIERLRWTSALIGLSGRGPSIEVEALEVDPADVDLEVECAVQSPDALPVALAAVLRKGLAGYRG